MLITFSENGWCKTKQQDNYLSSDKFWEMPDDKRQCKAGQMLNAEKKCGTKITYLKTKLMPLELAQWFFN